MTKWKEEYEQLYAQTKDKVKSTAKELQEVLANLQKIQSNASQITTEIQEKLNNASQALTDIQEKQGNASQIIAEIQIHQNNTTQIVNDIQEKQNNASQITAEIHAHQDNTTLAVTNIQEKQNNAAQIVNDIQAHQNNAAQIVNDIQAHQNNAAQIVNDIQAHQNNATQIVNDIQAHQNNATQMVNDIQAHQNNATQMVNDIQAHQNNATQVLADIQVHQKNVSRAATEMQANQNIVKKMVDGIRERQNEIGEALENAKDLEARRTRTALSGTFKKQATTHKWRAFFAGIVTLIITIAMIGIAVGGITMLIYPSLIPMLIFTVFDVSVDPSDVSAWDVYPLFLTMTVALGFLLWQTNKIRSQENRLHSEYTHKSSLSEAYTGYKQAAGADRELQSKLLDYLTEAIRRNPSQTLDHKAHHQSPFEELMKGLSVDDLKKLISKISVDQNPRNKSHGQPSSKETPEQSKDS